MKDEFVTLPKKDYEKLTKKKKSKYSKAVVTMIIILNVFFTSAVIAVFAKTSNEPTALIGCWFAFTTGELWLLSGIKKQKIKEVEKNEYQQDI